jgi:hypothetical protein
MFVDKLLVVKENKPNFCLTVNLKSEIIKNPIPILWNYQGVYGWIPIEIVKNEVSHFNNMAKNHSVTIMQLWFNWQQAYRLRPDVGKMLEELANELSRISNTK